MNAREFLDLQNAYQGVYQVDELWKGKHGQSEKEYQAGRSDAGKRISGDENTGPRHYTLGRARGAKPDAPTAPGARPVNTPKLSDDEKQYHQYNKSGAKRRAEYNKVGGSKGLPEEVDTFDAILEHLVAEGYADTNESALAIMANMSEEWRESIVEEVLDERNRGEQGMSDREVTRRRNLGGNVRSRVSASSLGDHGPQSAIQKFHKGKAKQRREIHKSGRGTRGDTGESGGQSRYQANKDHSDGYPSITKRGDGPY